jgi:hypothetical protein
MTAIPRAASLRHQLIVAAIADRHNRIGTELVNLPLVPRLLRLAHMCMVLEDPSRIDEEFAPVARSSG